MDVAEKSFELVEGTSKLLITLASALIAFSVTFSKELGGFTLDNTWDQITWSFSLACMAISVGSGIWTLLALATALSPQGSGSPATPTIRTRVVAVPFCFQIISFGMSAFFMALFGTGAVLWGTDAPDSPAVSFSTAPNPS